MVESLNQTAAANQSQCDELAAAVLAYCETNRFKIAAAESLTGGLLADAFVRVPGASKVFLGSAVTYDIRAKASILGVDAELLRREGAVHPEVARQMAFGTARLYRQREDGDCVVGLSTTGVAGPGPDGDKMCFELFKKLFVLIYLFFKLWNFSVKSVQSGFFSCHIHAP